MRTIVETLRARAARSAIGPPAHRARVAAVASILVFAAIWGRQLDKPLKLDDVDHYGIAAAIAETGRPVYYRGEEAPELNGALHPPLHDHLLAGWFRLFGTGVPQAMSFAAFSVLLHGLATLLIFRTLLPNETLSRIGAWFWPLFLLTPYTLQMASMVDIDSSIYGPMIALLLWSVVRLSWRAGAVRTDAPAEWEHWLVALLVALCLWTKLTTIWLALLFLPALMLCRMRPAIALVRSAAAIAGGVLLFFASFELACAAWGLDPDTTFQFVRMNAAAGPGVEAAIQTAKAMSLHLLRWTGLLPWLAACTVLLGASWVAWRRRRAEPTPDREIALLLLLALGTTVYYCATRHTFGNAPYKYAFTYFGILTVPLAMLASLPRRAASDAASSPAASRSASLLLPAAALAAGLAVGASVVRDEVVQNGWTRTTVALLWLPALAGAAVAGFALGRGAGRGRAIAVLRLALLAHVGVQLGIALHQSSLETSTTYDYGQRGLVATASFLRSRTRPDDRIASMKDLGLVAGRRYYETYGALYGGSAETERLIGRLGSGEVRYAVFTEQIGQDQLVVRPELRDWLDQNARLVASFGNYRVYEPRRPPAAGTAARSPG